jgi:hypothetical protein
MEDVRCSLVGLETKEEQEVFFVNVAFAADGVEEESEEGASAQKRSMSCGSSWKRRERSWCIPVIGRRSGVSVMRSISSGRRKQER